MDQDVTENALLTLSEETEDFDSTEPPKVEEGVDSDKPLVMKTSHPGSLQEQPLNVGSVMISARTGDQSGVQFSAAGDKEGQGTEECVSERTRLNPVIDTRTQTFQLLTHENKIVLTWNKHYFRSCTSMLRLLQVVLSVISLLCLSTSGRREGGLLLLPLGWHFRIMVFILLLTSMTSLLLWLANVTGIIFLFPFNWNFIDMVVYSVFSFLYLVGASMVASVVDFYQKMDTEISLSTVQQLILCVVIGYMCMVVYGLTALVGYRQWRIQYKLYQRRRLLEEEDFDN